MGVLVLGVYNNVCLKYKRGGGGGGGETLQNIVCVCDSRV